MLADSASTSPIDAAPLHTSPLPSYTATYSCEDNRLRLYASRRLDAETYARVKAAGFSWAPKQALFVAPMWTPEREDLLLELAGEIDCEESTMAERAEVRAERFAGYSDKREIEAHAAHEHVKQIADGIPMGQPILLAHHSEKRARKDAERIESGMRKAVRLWDTACYWEERAAGVQHHASYKAAPDVRARRIKGLEADKRKQEREIEAADASIRIWEKVSTVEEPEQQRAFALRVANVSALAPSGVWSALDRGTMTGAEAAEKAIARAREMKASAERWIAHLVNRLAYERVLLGRAPDQETPKVIRRSAKAALPLLNYRAPGGVPTKNPYHDRIDTLAQHDMCAAEYAKLHTDYKGTSVSGDGTHRVRVAMVKFCRVSVFLTDSKVHVVPA